ncbi:MAG: GGDEF domain-containing protein [bacterium]
MTEQLREAAEVDALTQLFNRRVMMRDLDMLISQAVRYSYPLAVLLMDLDNFKKVNDQHGHLVGDEILRVMARVCSNVVRDSDVLCRYGGEEFAVVCPNTDVNGALVLAERIRAHVANQDFVVSGETHRVTLSIGVGTLSAKCATKEALLKEADDCMYRAKKEGKNRVRSIGMSSQQQTG